MLLLAFRDTTLLRVTDGRCIAGTIRQSCGIAVRCRLGGSAAQSWLAMGAVTPASNCYSA